MKNEIIHASVQEIKKVKEKVKNDKRVFVAELEGQDCLCKEDYMNLIWDIFSFPVLFAGIIRKSWDSYYDWFTDLTWLEDEGKEEFIIIVYNYDQFLREDLPAKEEFMYGFREVILPWWEDEVVEHVVGGVPRKMTLYLENKKQFVPEHRNEKV